MGISWSQPTKRLIVLRGLPGSGKSTLATQLNETYGGEGLIYSTDDFFIESGKYNLNMKKIKDAHMWNQKRTVDAMKEDSNLIIINNCNARLWEVRPYIEAAVKYNYTIDIHEPNTAWKNDTDELLQKSNGRHNLKYIKRMKAEWDDDFTIKNILASEAPWEKQVHKLKQD
jgi:predicted kinase